MEKMKAYFTVIKRLQPQVSEEANTILARYYQLQRQSDGRNAARTTIRMLESLSRLAEGEDGLWISYLSNNKLHPSRRTVLTSQLTPGSCTERR